MTTETLFREDSYLKECDATVLQARGNAVVLDRTVFYPMGGGQPGDSGTMSWSDGSAAIVDTRYGEDGNIEHILADGSDVPRIG
ncbi:MAG: alanine--tRNA ligase-related protein, partial [Woeseiaceae bacterium]